MDRIYQTTPLNELVLAYIVAERNAQIASMNADRAQQTPPLEPLAEITADSFWQDANDTLFRQWAENGTRIDRLIDRAIGDLFTRPPEVQGAVIAALGLAGVPPGVLPGILADGVGRTRFLALTPAQQNAMVALVYPAG